MGTRYNAAHISEAAVKEAWSNYAKYDYFYTDELQKAQKTLESTTSSAKAQLAAKGIFEGDPKYTREIDRITNIAQADMASLQAGQTSLQTGAIKDLLTSGSITKYSAGNYGAYAGSIFRDRERAGLTGPQEGDQYSGVYRSSISGGGSTGWTFVPDKAATAPSSRFGVGTGEAVAQPASLTGVYRQTSEGEVLSKGESLSVADYTAMMEKARTPLKSFQDYYTGVWGGYDPHFDVRADQERTSEETARGKAGSRAYTIQAQPKGQPGGGKPGNVFMQTPEEVAQDQAPQDEQGKAWWM